jgi:branched-chain amino acid transport system permease protein
MRDRISSLRDHVLARHLAAALLGLVVVVLVVESVSDYRNTQLASMAYLGIAAGGLTVLTGLNGQLSLGHGALMAIGAYTSALLLPDNESSLPLSVVVLAAVLVTLVVGAAVGLAAARLHGPYLAGATLALAVAVPGIALYFKETLGGEQGLRVVMPDIPVWVLDAVFFVTGQDLTRSRFTAYVGWLTLIVVFVLLANLGAGRTGRRWRAVRDDEVAAELAGIDLGRARVSAFMVSAAAAGAAGAILAFTVKLAAPSAFTLTLSLTLLAAIVLGGLGSLAGALIGAALLTFLPSVVTDLGTDAGLSDIQAAELAPLVYGLVMVAVILLAPAGLVGSLRGALLRARSRRRTPPGAGTGSGTTSGTAPSADAEAPTTSGDSDTASTTPATTSKGTAS